MSTRTSNFGVSRREGHDASGFYGRFEAPVLSSDDHVAPPKPVADPFACGDARHMAQLADGSVALVVTSPPYFAGKQYEEELQREGVPASYLEYLDMLRDVFSECGRVLEPGGRIAVNIANLGRRPYRSLAADVIRILQDDLGLLLRGELIWRKGEGASGSCAWGSFASAANPVLRDVTERVVVASKGRFDRARSVAQRKAEHLPHESTITAEDFMAFTLDTWTIAPERASRVGHPAPFPVELPEALIRLYTFVDDLVLDPFMGSGSALVAAARLGRRYAGYDLDMSYVAAARERVAEVLLEAPLVPRDPRPAGRIARQALGEAGFHVEREGFPVPRSGVTVSFRCRDAGGAEWLFDMAGANTSQRGGLLRGDVMWKALGRAAVVRSCSDAPLALLTTQLPPAHGAAGAALRAAVPAVVADVIDVTNPADLDRLRARANSRR